MCDRPPFDQWHAGSLSGDSGKLFLFFNNCKGSREKISPLCCPCRGPLNTVVQCLELGGPPLWDHERKSKRIKEIPTFNDDITELQPPPSSGLPVMFDLKMVCQTTCFFQVNVSSSPFSTEDIFQDPHWCLKPWTLWNSMCTMFSSYI